MNDWGIQYIKEIAQISEVDGSCEEDKNVLEWEHAMSWLSSFTGKLEHRSAGAFGCPQRNCEHLSDCVNPSGTVFDSFVKNGLIDEKVLFLTELFLLYL